MSQLESLVNDAAVCVLRALARGVPMRLFIDQLAALDRLRGGDGRQTVRVERVTVEAGGQAVVGAVTTTPVAASPAAPHGDAPPDA